jgi:hypothetical protein
LIRNGYRLSGNPSEQTASPALDLSFIKLLSLFHGLEQRCKRRNRIGGCGCRTVCHRQHPIVDHNRQQGFCQRISRTGIDHGLDGIGNRVESLFDVGTGPLPAGVLDANEDRLHDGEVRFRRCRSQNLSDLVFQYGTEEPALVGIPLPQNPKQRLEIAAG